MDIELLLAALPGRIGRYFLTSTVDVYGHRFPRGYAEHQAPTEPLTAPDPLPYDVGKRGCEHLLRHSGMLGHSTGASRTTAGYTHASLRYLSAELSKMTLLPPLPAGIVRLSEASRRYRGGVPRV